MMTDALLLSPEPIESGLPPWELIILFVVADDLLPFVLK